MVWPRESVETSHRRLQKSQPDPVWDAAEVVHCDCRSPDVNVPEDFENLKAEGRSVTAQWGDLRFRSPHEGVALPGRLPRQGLPSQLPPSSQM